MLHITFSEQDIAELRYERYHHPHPRVQMKEVVQLRKEGALSNSGRLSACRTAAPNRVRRVC